MLLTCVVQAEWPHVVVALSVDNELHLYDRLRVIDTRELLLLAFVEKVFLAVMVEAVVPLLLASSRGVGKPRGA